MGLDELMEYVRFVWLGAALVKRGVNGSSDLGLHVVEPSDNKRRLQIEITFILTVCCSTEPQLDHIVATTTGPDPTPAPSDGGLHISESRTYCQVSLPCM